MTFEILMKRKNLDKSFRSCPAFSVDQPFKNHCTFDSKEAAEKHMVDLMRRHCGSVEFRIVRFVQG